MKLESLLCTFLVVMSEKKDNGLSITINYKIVNVISNIKYKGDTRAYDAVCQSVCTSRTATTQWGLNLNLQFLTVQTKDRLLYDLTNYFVVFNVVNNIILF